MNESIQPIPNTQPTESSALVESALDHENDGSLEVFTDEQLIAELVRITKDYGVEETAALMNLRLQAAATTDEDLRVELATAYSNQVQQAIDLMADHSARYKASIVSVVLNAVFHFSCQQWEDYQRTLDDDLLPMLPNLFDDETYFEIADLFQALSTSVPDSK